MRIVLNNLLPFKGFGAMNLFGILFLRVDWVDNNSTDTICRLFAHERIHSAQMKELLYVGFYACYLAEWIYRLLFHTKSAYYGISFEREAYANQDNPDYLETRKRFAQWRRK